jgi:hypothetical protein
MPSVVDVGHVVGYQGNRMKMYERPPLAGCPVLRLALSIYV